MPTKKFGSYSEQADTRFRTSGDNKVVTVQPQSSLAEASNTLTLPVLSSGNSTDTLLGRISQDTGTNRLQNKDLDAGTVIFTDAADIANRRLSFNLSAFTTARVVPLPDSASELANLDSVQTLSNKLLDTVSINDAAGGTSGQVYNIVPSELAASQNLTLPAITADDTFALLNFNQTFTNKSINADQNTITNIDNNEIKAAAGIELTKLAALTADRAVETDASGFLIPSAVTNTELNFLDGVTSSIQTQIDSKVGTALNNLSVVGLAAESLLVGSGANSVTNLTVGTNGQVLTISGGAVGWSNPAGTGDVTSAANILDNSLVRGDGGGKGVQQSGILIDDSDNMSGVGILVSTDLVGGSVTVASGDSGFISRAVLDTGVVVTIDSGASFRTSSIDATNGELIVNGEFSTIN